MLLLSALNDTRMLSAIDNTQTGTQIIQYSELLYMLKGIKTIFCLFSSNWTNLGLPERSECAFLIFRHIIYTK